MENNKTICLVDDHMVVRIGIKTWLEQNTDWKILQDFGSKQACLDFFSENKNHLPSIVIIDIDLGNESGFDLLTEIKKEYPQIKTILYSMHEESGYILQAQKLGADSYIPKGDDMSEFSKCLDAIYDGKKYLNSKIQEKNNKISEMAIFLTEKQKLLLQELLKNKTNEEISRKLNLSLHTVEVYITVIYDTMGVKNRTELVQKFI